jgi:hypothetical protein
VAGLLSVLLFAGSAEVANAVSGMERLSGDGAFNEVPGPAHAVGEGPGDLTPNQLFAGRSLTREEALAACGPAAAVAFARAKGQSITLDTAVAFARDVGWTAKRGMAGPNGQMSLLKSLGVPARLETGIDRGKIVREVQAGRPVIVRTVGGGGHYFVAERVDPNSGRFDFGQSALVLRAAAGRRWFSLDELPSLGVGSPSHAIFLADAAAAPPPPPTRAVLAPSIPAAMVSAATAVASGPSRVVDTGGPAARVRAAPGLDGKILGLVPDGARLTDLGVTQRVSGRTWRQVSLASGTRAWIDDGLLRPAR